MLPHKDATHPKRITLPNIKNFLEAYARKWFGWFSSIRESDDVVGLYTDQTSKEERILELHNDPSVNNQDKVWMIRQELVAEKSPKCLAPRDNGVAYCVHCGCETLDKLYETNACELGCYKEWPSDTH